MRINSIYRACEGEGINIGTPQVFIRTQGCSLHCKNCDTLNSWNPSHGTEMSIEEVLAEVAKYNLDNVSITGGNPLEAERMLGLIEALNEEGYIINIEATGQDFDSQVLDAVDFISCDIKTPSTGVEADLGNIIKILDRFGYKMQLKMVCASDEDLDFIVEIYKKLERMVPSGMFVITPCYTERDKDFDYSMIDKAFNRILDEKLDIRVIMQQHKVVYGSKRADV